MSSHQLTPDDVRNAAFPKPPIGRRGYDEDQVDDFLDRVEAALRGADPLTAAEVRQVTFTPAKRLRRGYAEDEVDDLLDRAAAALRHREQTGSGELDRPQDTAAPEVRTPDPNVPFLPLPPAPPGMWGYRPEDVTALTRLLTRVATSPANPPTVEDLTSLHLRLGPGAGQGYHQQVVDAVVQSWIAELRRRESGPK